MRALHKGVAAGVSTSRPPSLQPCPAQWVATRRSASKSRLTARADGADGGRQPWDFFRFVKTVAYFNELPSPDKLLQGLVKQLSPQGAGDSVVPVELPQASSSGAVEVPITGIVMVTGATGGVGRRVVARLLAAGKHVRALVRDLEKARGMLSDLPVAPGGKLELAAADVTQRQTLLPEMFEGVRAVVCCTAVKVVPKEGDTVDRSKYYQGIKFYDPEIQGDTPEAVEYVGMENLLDAVADSLGVEGGVRLLDAASASSSSGSSAGAGAGSGVAGLGAGGGAVARWGPLDDVVMGGVSSSGIELVTGAGEAGGAAWVFSGNVSTDNFGGFASVRTRNLDPPLDLSPYEGIQLRLFGDGQRYKFIIRPDSNWDGIAYCNSFDTTPSTWQTIRLPFADFFPVFRAKRLSGPTATPLDPSAISSIQIMLSKFEYDGDLNPAFRRGPFRLPFTSIAAYLPAGVPPRFVHVSSAGVTRPNRPGIDVNQEPPAVKLNDTLGGILTWKLAGEDSLRDSGVPFAVVRPTALTEEPGGMPLELDQGDTVKGKISRDDVADLCVALLGCPAATNTTFEVKSTVPFSQPWTGPEPSAPRRDWFATLNQARLRPGVTGRTVLGVYTGRKTEVEALAAAGVSTSDAASKPTATAAA
ncbi:hypothetical protein CHLRE_05g244800v5 [Chlamydomonas reinhardtii]|uniref:NADH:ubiquinone oxidoreductase intermediate-associated protein 30 domain-containing protein n=1 Tax=Chlamydomonas reinhardtii TaxID=3055 RepID=A0A2K3DSB1_CHLRE|nr:uncharacterized protein CHLRE_05g244800v5 [Chlamydomonas reinhardtii]PNW83397.1 hypothetical protein CHLRE_05g244800v5 [Chlamydomonas reinhardtii]